MPIQADSRVFVAGRSTLLGAAIVRQLQCSGIDPIDGEPNLRDASEVDHFFRAHRPEFVFLLAGLSGGIAWNQDHPAELMLDNLSCQTHVIHASHRHRVRKLLYLASSCCYPRHCPQPMSVDSLMSGRLEPTNEAYATAKLAGLVLCQAFARQYGDCFVQAVPCNAFGIDDDFSPQSGHVIPALLHRMHRAHREQWPRVDVWGSGRPQRQFQFADDLADACLFVMRNYDDALTPINLGGSDNLSIAEVALAVQRVVGYQGELYFDTSKPDGMPLKALDVQPLAQLGWQPRTTFSAALAQTCHAYLQQASLERSQACA